MPAAIDWSRIPAAAVDRATTLHETARGFSLEPMIHQPRMVM